MDCGLKIPFLNEYARLQQELEMDLRAAVAHQDLSLFYQPQFDICSGKVCGVEALARWFRGGTPIAPSVFIPLAEHTGVIGELGSWALRTGCKMLAEWRRGLGHQPTLSINVSTLQIRESFTDEIFQALRSNGLAGEQLELEITESILLEQADPVLTCLRQWKGLGVRIALDDFGSGYSNLGYLARLPIDRLKLDGSLIRGMTSESKGTTIVKAMIALGRDLGITVLAEGVESEEQLSMLARLGCQQAQGYLMTPPVPADAARSIMRKRWGARAIPHASCLN